MWSACKKQTRSVWKTCWNVKKQWLYNRKFFVLFVSSKKTKTKKKTIIPQQINFVGKLDEDDRATMFFTAEKQQKTILNFSLDSLIVTD